MANIAKRNFRKINVNKITPTFIISKLRDKKTNKTRWHIECMNRVINGTQGCKNIKSGLNFKFCNNLE